MTEQEKPEPTESMRNAMERLEAGLQAALERDNQAHILKYRRAIEALKQQAKF